MTDQPQRILVVDDDADQREITQGILETAGYEIATAESEADALARVEEHPPDLLILDVMMKHLDGGFAVCQKLKSDPRYRDIPVIMVTGIREKMRVDFSPAGDGEYLPADEFLEKPINPAVLLDKVAKLLGS